MPNKEYVTSMARYNLWQNQNLLKTANTLSEKQRQQDNGAFFGSIQKTFSHLLWADMLWLSRFTSTQAPKGGIPQSVNLVESWTEFSEQRIAFDNQILDWAKNVKPDWFEGELSWFSGAINREISKSKKMLVLQLFNHQTHHRGQIHAMLTAAGAKPGDTDVPFMPDSFLNL